MSTFKERQAAKLERYQGYAEHAKERAQVASDKTHALLDAIPFGQPILVGHHSESGHRNRLKRADNAMRTACEESDKAKHWQSRARHLRLESEVENQGFAVGDKGIAKWTNCNYQYESPCHITKINDRSMLVKLDAEVWQHRAGWEAKIAYPLGWTIKIPLTQSGTFTSGNQFIKA